MATRPNSQNDERYLHPSAGRQTDAEASTPDFLRRAAANGVVGRGRASEAGRREQASQERRPTPRADAPGSRRSQPAGRTTRPRPESPRTATPRGRTQAARSQTQRGRSVPHTASPGTTPPRMPTPRQPQARGAQKRVSRGSAQTPRPTRRGAVATSGRGVAARGAGERDSGAQTRATQGQTGSRTAKPRSERMQAAPAARRAATTRAARKGPTRTQAGASGHSDGNPENTGFIPAVQSAELGPGSAPRHVRKAPVGGGSRSLLVAAVVLGVAAVVLALFLVVPFEAEEVAPVQTDETGTVEITVPEGATGTSIADDLVEQGLIPKASEFTTAITQAGDATGIQPGVYVIDRGASLDSIVKLFQKGPNSIKGRLIIPPGATVKDTAAKVEEALGIPTDTFMAAAKASAFVDAYSFLKEAADDSLEGFLWAGAYNFIGESPTASEVIVKMLDAYSAQAKDFAFASGETAIQNTYGLNLNNYAILKVASIIEKEAYNDADRPLIASVIYNRLRDNMRLQSDATIVYELGREPTVEELEQDSPYNTYTRDGLPPTPICTPSKASVDAALAPAQTNYYFFFIIDGNGYSQHSFSETYEQHLQAIEAAKGH